VFIMVIDLEESLRMTKLAESHASINSLLTVGKINEVAFPFVALIMEFSAVAVIDISCRVYCQRNRQSNDKY